MIHYRELSWWYWAVTTVLLIAGLAGRFEAFYLVTALSALQVCHSRLREGNFAGFSVQVRVAYTGMLVLALCGSMNGLFGLLAIGTLAQVLLGYCTLARCLSLLPWNRLEPMSRRLVWQTFSAPPVKGDIMRGLPRTP